MDIANPFDDESREFIVLVNHLNQHSLWPISFPIPTGWTTIGLRGRRRECLDWIEKNWTDITPTPRTTG